MKYTVAQYLTMLKRAKRSPKTIESYSKVFRSFAQCLDISVDEIHDHLLPENLIKYAESREEKSDRATNVSMSILSRYYKVNGITFDELERNVIKGRPDTAANDKPLELATLKKMMEIGSVHAKAMITFLISTGCRRNETAQILVSDVKGDQVTIRPEIAKRRKGGIVYLTAEAREYLDLWLDERDAYIQHANTKKYREFRPADDQRLFACSQNTMRDIFARLYQKVDGERGPYGDRCTMHSCRKYFRTQAVRTIPLEVVEKIMRHSGYLTQSYVRITDVETRRLFHEGEHALYILRNDARTEQAEIEILRKEKKELENQLTRAKKELTHVKMMLEKN